MGTSNHPPETPLASNASLPSPHKGKVILLVTAALLVLLAAAVATVIYFTKKDLPAKGAAVAATGGQIAGAGSVTDFSASQLPLSGSDLAQALEGARRLLDKAGTETYDVPAAAKMLGDDVDKTFVFVRDNFAFDPYTGCLRGAQGTLMARAGNDIDRSLLLAALLSEHSHGVRLVQGKLSADDATRLLDRAKLPPALNPISNISAEDAAAVSGLPVADLQKLIDTAKASAQQITQKIDARTQHDTDFIQQELQSAGIHLSASAGVSTDGVRNHVWVQVQVDGDWKDLDSSFPDAKVGQHFAEPEGGPIAADALPEDWYQTVRLRVLSFAPAGGDPDELLNRQLHVAAVVAKPLDLAFVPQDNDDPLQANTFQPTLVSGADRFTGKNIEVGPAKAGGGITDGLLGGLGGGGDEEAGKEKAKPLPKIMLEVTLAGPGAAPERMTRTIADISAIPDPAQRVAEMRDQLISLYQFVVGVGPISPDWVASQLLAFLKPLLSAGGKDRVIIPMDLLCLAMAATQGDSQGDQPRRYYARPLLLAQRVRFRHGPGGKPVFVKTLDILHNRVEFLGGDALAAVRQGALETELERAAFPGTEVLNTVTVFERTQAAVRVLGPGDADGLGKIDLSAEAKVRIADDLASGYAVIVPAASVQIGEMPATGWWRVRPQGGETLGRMQSGEGQGMVEKAITEGSKFLPSGYSFAANAYCKRAGRTDGFCNPCLIAGAGALGSLIGIYGWLVSSGWGAAKYAVIMTLGAYGMWTKAPTCGGWIIDTSVKATSQ